MDGVTPIRTPVSKRKIEDSQLSDDMNSLSPLKTVKSIPISQTLSPSSFTSHPAVFTYPDAASYKESRFKSKNNSSNLSKDGVASNEEVASIGEEKEKSLLETEPPQILKDDCNTPGVINGAGDSVWDVYKMFENVLAEGETLISEEQELIYGLTDHAEVSSCFLNTTSNSEALPTSEPVSNTDVPNNEYESFDDDSILHRGVIRRRLEFAIPGNNQKPLVDSSSRCLVPSIGLHENAFAMSYKDNNVGLQGPTSPRLRWKHETMRKSESGKEVLKPVEEVPKPVEEVLKPVEEVLKPVGEVLMPVEEVLEEVLMPIEEVLKSSVLKELNPIGSNKKRCKSEQSGEGVSSCKRCKCKKSKCLKLYCECFAAGVYCMDTCSCVDCLNKAIYANTVLAAREKIVFRNPLAFAPKVIRSSDSIIKVGDNTRKTPASARHRRGCNCKKSNCLKKYCECYQSGVGCSMNCRCERCENEFGTKNGSMVDQDQENKTSGESGTAKTLQNVELVNPAAPASTPMPLRQPLAQLPISSNTIMLPPLCHYHHHGASGSVYHIRPPDMSMSYSRMQTITEYTDDMSHGNRQPLAQLPISSNNIKLPPPSHHHHHHHHGASGCPYNISPMTNISDESIPPNGKRLPDRI